MPRPTKTKAKPRRTGRRGPGYADSVAIIVIASILVMIAVIYGLTHLGSLGNPPLASPAFSPRPVSPSPSPSDLPSPSESPSPSPTASPTDSPLPTMSPYGR